MSTLVQVMAWCRQATSHYLSQCWPRSLSPYGVTGPQWVKVRPCNWVLLFLLTLWRWSEITRGALWWRAEVRLLGRGTELRWLLWGRPEVWLLWGRPEFLALRRGHQRPRRLDGSDRGGLHPRHSLQSLLHRLLLLLLSQRHHLGLHLMDTHWWVSARKT